MLRKVIEAKVKWATSASTLVGLLVAALNWANDNPGVFGGLPMWLQGLLLVLIPPTVTFLGGYLAPHTPRTPGVDPENYR